MEYIEKALKIIPVVSLALIFSGYIHIHTYYTLFGIQIYNYMDISEIIFAFVSNIWEIFFSIAAVTLMSVYFYFSRNIYTRILYKPIVRQMGNSLYGVLKLLFRFYLVTWVLVLLLDLYLFYWQRGDYVYEPTFKTILFFLIILIPLGLFVLYYLMQYEWSIENLIQSATVVCFVLFIIYSIIIPFIQYFNIQDGYPKYNITMTLNDSKEVKTNDSFFFIGLTKNFYFFRDLKSQTNIIIPASEVIEIRQQKID